MTQAMVLVSAAPPARRELLDRIDRLTLSADAKALLARLGAVAVEAGCAVVEVGRFVLHFALETVKTLPNTTFGMIVGTALSWLVGSVPLLGAVLGPLLGPLLVVFGLGVGFVADVRDGELGARVRGLADELGARLGG